MTDDNLATLLDLPSEILTHVLRSLTTPSFVQTILTCHQLFDLAVASREVILHHLHQVPGIKLGLEDQILSTAALFLILRQRAAAGLYGTNFHADCEDLRFEFGTLNPTASCLTDSFGDARLSLVMKESHNVRHYNIRGTLQDYTPPYDDREGKPVQVVHWKGTTSILYEHLAYADTPYCNCDEGSEFHPNVRCSGIPCDSELVDPFTNKTYHLVHYKAHMNDRPDLFHITPPDVLVPKTRGQPSREIVPLRLTIHNRLKCAILWGEPVKSDSDIRTTYLVNSKNPTTQVILYTCDRLPARPDEESTPEAVVLYPIQRPSTIDEASPTTPSALDRNIEYLSQYRPRSIAFVEGGRYLKLYRAGSITPYAILPSTITSRAGLRRQDQRFSRLKNDVHIGLNAFKIESPFFGQHTFDLPHRPENEPHSRECFNVYLHLATASALYLPSYASDTGQGDIYLVQNRITTEEEDCEHVIDLDDTGRVPYDELRVVARLWGWNSALLANSTLTAVDSVCVSPKGTRIAIACWDRILVWPVYPEILCEAWVTEERHEPSDLDDASVVSVDSTPGDPPVISPGTTIESGLADNGSDNSSDASSSVSNDDDDAHTSQLQPAMVKATKFYDLVRHPLFGEIVELRPIVLKLPGGAIAWKLMWTSTDQESFDKPTSNVADDLSDVGNYDAGRHSAGSSENEFEHASNGLEAGQTGESAYNAVMPTRLTEEDYLDEGPNLTAERKQEIDFIGAELETLVGDNIRSEDSIPPAGLVLGDSSPEDLRNEKLDDEAVQADVEATAPLEHEIHEAGMNDAPQTSTASENVMSTCMPETDVHQSTSESKQVQLHDTDFNLPQDFDNTLDFNLNFSTLDNTNVLENFDFDSFLNSANDGAIIFDAGVAVEEFASNHMDSVPNTMLPLPNLAPAPYDFDSRPPSPLEIRDTYWPRPKQNPGRKRKPKRDAEDDLLVLTDRGVQVWDLGVWAKGRRERGWLEEKLP